MATTQQRRALLAVSCGWCHAAPGEVCTRANGSSRRDQEGGVRRGGRLPVTVLDGNAHDARWLAAGLGPAPVVVSRLRELHAPAEPSPLAELATADDRPW